MKDHKHKGGWLFIFQEAVKDNSKVIDIVRQYNNFYVHKQIELKNGLIYVRLKKRPLAPVHA